MRKSNELYSRLTADLNKDPSSKEIKGIVSELMDLFEEIHNGIDMGENYWGFMSDEYLCNPVYIKATDETYGKGAACFIGKALKTIHE
jgi:hypothetical protein